VRELKTGLRKIRREQDVFQCVIYFLLSQVQHIIQRILDYIDIYILNKKFVVVLKLTYYLQYNLHHIKYFYMYDI